MDTQSVLLWEPLLPIAPPTDIISPIHIILYSLLILISTYFTFDEETTR